MSSLTDVASHLSAQLDADVITLRSALVDLSRHLQREFGVSRVTVWGIDGKKGSRRMRRAGGFDGVAESEISERASFVDEQVTAYLGTLSARGLHASTDTFADPFLAALKENYLMPLDIRASLDVAVSINGEMIAVFCFAQQGATRRWTANESVQALDFAMHVAILRARRLGGAGKALSLMQELDPH